MTVRKTSSLPTKLPKKEEKNLNPIIINGGNSSEQRGNWAVVQVCCNRILATASTYWKGGRWPGREACRPRRSSLFERDEEKKYSSAEGLGYAHKLRPEVQRVGICGNIVLAEMVPEKG